MFITATATATATATSHLVTTSCNCVSQCEFYLFHTDVKQKNLLDVSYFEKVHISRICVRSMLLASTATATCYETHHLIHTANLCSVLI